MALISLQEVSLGFGGPLLLDSVNLQIERGEYIGLLGRNGMGKTSLLKVICGAEEPDSGSVVKQQNLRIAYLPQETPTGLSGKTSEIIAAGLDSLPDGAPTAGAAWPENAWKRQLQLEKVISRMQLNPVAPFEKLSAGLKRRVLLGRALVNKPDLLLLDEPTNHMDIEAIAWLENFLLRWSGTLVFVTHDRAFLQRLAARIIEIDRGRLFDWNCDYPTFLDRKEALLSAELEQNLNFDKKLAQEEQWIRRGIEARRTRNEGRVRALKALRETRRERREQPGKMRLLIQDARRSGKLVIDAENISYSYSERPIIQDFSITVLRGDRIGIVGRNGSGKTTLLRMLMGELSPQEGEVRLGTNLEIAYFDQLRGQLDENKSVFENAGDGRDTVIINGKQRSLYGYLEDFQFSPARVHVPTRTLSGGERNRLLLAKLFTRPANLLVMDEPTNDLDLETLEILENLLLQYRGTLLLVSHDRTLLNNLATSILALDGSGKVSEVVGGYDDWAEQSSTGAASINGETSLPRDGADRLASAERGPAAPTETETQHKLSYNEKRQLDAYREELARLPERIENLEAKQHELTLAMTDPLFYQQDADKIAGAASQLKKLEEELAQLYSRWEELEFLLQ
jgi:ABC transport system ATP-binding/permease protein